MCTITIDPNVEGEEVGGALTLIRVKGTSTDCKEIKVTIRCGTAAPLSKVAIIDFAPTPNTWVAESTDAAELEALGCQCGGNIDVTAECGDVPGCFADPISTPLNCEGECPEVIIAHSVSENCVGGKREVTLITTNLGPENPNAQWEVEPGVFVPVSPFTLPVPVGTDTKFHDYVPGTHTAILHIENCPDESMVIDVSECPPDVECPSIGFDVNRMNCKDDGTQPIQIKATLTGPAGTTISAELKEGVTVLDSASSTTGVLELNSPTIDFAPGSHTITAEVITPDGCPSASTTFEVECEPKGACCLPDGSCEELTEAECRESGGDYKGDGTSCADVECGDGNGNGGCPWYDPRCWSLCGALGALLALIIAGYLVAIAAGLASDISGFLSGIPGFPTIDPTTLIAVIGGVIAALMAGYAAICGLCNLGKAMVAGAVLGVITIFGLWLLGVPLPHWLGAVITALVIGLTGYALIEAECD